MGLDTRCLGGRKVAAIGPATADILVAKGVRPDFVPPKYVAESVVEGLKELGVGQGTKVLIPRARVAREVLPEELAKAGRAGARLARIRDRPQRVRPRGACGKAQGRGGPTT